MGHKKDNEKLRTRRQLDRLKWETAKELGLEEGAGPAGEELEPDNRRVQDEKGAVKRGEEALAEEGKRKAELNLTGVFKKATEQFRKRVLDAAKRGRGRQGP